MASGRITWRPIQNAGDVTTLNQNGEDIEAALDNVLSRQPNNLPNSMNTNLDMNGYFILNQGNPVTISSFNYVGEWTQATSYSEGDAVSYNSSSYLCQIDNTSSSVFLTDLLANKWTPIVLGQKYQGEWSGPGTAYYIGDIVFVSSDAFYVCIENSFSTSSFSNDLASGYWEIYGDTLGTMALQNANSVNITGGTAALTSATLSGPVTLSNQATNKSYVDGTNVLNTTGYKIFPGGYIEQWTTITIAPGDITASTSTSDFIIWSASGSSLTFTYPLPFTNSYLGCSVQVIQTPFAGGNFGSLQLIPTQPTSTSLTVAPNYITSTGVIPTQNMILSVKVWGN